MPWLKNLLRIIFGIHVYDFMWNMNVQFDAKTYSIEFVTDSMVATHNDVVHTPDSEL